MPATLKIQIVSRYVPSANRAGHFTYLREIMRYLADNGAELELAVLDPWFLPENIPVDLRRIAAVVIMPAAFVQDQHDESPRPSRRKLFRPLYTHLPARLKIPLRATWYRLRKQPIPGHHLPDATATPAETAFIAERVAQRCPHVLMTNETFLGNILDAYQNQRDLLKINIAFDLHHQRQAQFRQAKSLRPASEWSRPKEINLLQAADLVVAIHADDAATLRAMLPQSEVLCAPMSATCYAHDPAEQVPGRCLLVASDIEHNVQGLRWFLARVWPLILRSDPNCVLHVCGKVCSQIHANYPNVRLLGRVDDVGREYGAAEVCIIPLIVGSGLKIKLVEALSHGRACVATSVGVQGVRELTDRAVLVADTPEDFARAMVAVFRHPEQRRAMEAEARRYVAEHLSPEKAYQPLFERISRHIRQNFQ